MKKENTTSREIVLEDFDELLIELAKNGESSGRIKMSTENIKMLMNLHEQSFADILELMVECVQKESKIKKG